jgi:YesN/AraC family two-component response regulator
MEIQIQDNDRMNVVYNYIKDHFQENISIDEISELVSTVSSFAGILRRSQ